MVPIKHYLKRALYTIQMYFGLFPKLYIPIYKLFGKNRRLLVNESSEIVIEGFPRSGNTFSVAALEWSQHRPLNIAHHLHSASQVIWAFKHNIPAVVLIREPKDAVVSFVIREPYLTLKIALRSYISFYTAILPLKNDLLIVTFDELTTDFGGVINKINKRYETAYSLFDHSSENVEKVFELVQSYGVSESPAKRLDEKKVARPSCVRNEMAVKYRNELDSKKYDQLIIDAKNLYVSFTTQQPPAKDRWVRFSD
ncbi:MAG: hypothetical protein L3J26_11855 [Candidatus Polarisedimenticolaceae bacterium]|nr:hypothetical protein [Candidatus Polarisedimenticolaceae bacterium]